LFQRKVKGDFPVYAHLYNGSMHCKHYLSAMEKTENNSELRALIRKNAHLFWYIKDSEKETLPLPVVLEFFINYANKEHIKELFRIVGIKNAAAVFFEQVNQWGTRSNYFPELQNYFTLYFKRYAS
jgi:hypothetical protein